MTISSRFGCVSGVSVADGEGAMGMEAVEGMLAVRAGVAVLGLPPANCVVQVLNIKPKQHRIKKVLPVIIVLYRDGIFNIPALQSQAAVMMRESVVSIIFGSRAKILSAFADKFFTPAYSLRKELLR